MVSSGKDEEELLLGPADAAKVSRRTLRLLQLLLTRAVCAWAGVPLPAAEVNTRTRQLSALFDQAGHVGVGHLRSRAARKAADRWAADIIGQVRAGKLDPPASSAAYGTATS